VPAPRVFPREPKCLPQANITIDHRSQIIERGKEKRQTERQQTESEREHEERRRHNEKARQRL
jgi:hypothetical protein